MKHAIDLSRYFRTQQAELSRESGKHRSADRRLQAIIEAIAAASTDIAALVSLGRFSPAEAKSSSSPSRLIELDRDTDPAGRAQTILAERLSGCGVKELVCAGRGAPMPLDAQGLYVVAVDALDGASNIDTNMPLGTIFSISFGGDTATAPSGAMQLAAGFVVYGPQTNLVLTLGNGVDIFIFDRDDGTYRPTDESVRIPATSSEYAIDASNYRHWPSAVRTMIDDHREASSTPGAQAFNMRWMGSLVAEAYRILRRGGVFLCPPDTRKTCENGCQRVLTAAHPIAFIMEQAGGAATTGYGRVIDRTVQRVDERTALIFGSRDTVEKIERLHALPDSYADASPLFGKRGLFRI